MKKSCVFERKYIIGFLCVPLIFAYAYTAYGQTIQKITVPKISAPQIQKDSVPPSEKPSISSTGQTTQTASWQPPQVPQQASMQDQISSASANIPIANTAPSAPEPIKGVTDLKKLKVKVPDYEDRYKKMMEAAIAQKMAKKRTFLESISDEITKYGFFIVFGLVVVTVIITLKIDRTKQKELTTVNAKPDEEMLKKTDIWNEDF